MCDSAHGDWFLSDGAERNMDSLRYPGSRLDWAYLVLWLSSQNNPDIELQDDCATLSEVTDKLFVNAHGNPEKGKIILLVP